MSITLSELKGKRVYAQDARCIGEVVDIGFKVGELSPSIVVKTPSGRTLEIPWSDVAAAKDIVLLKPEFKVPEELLVPAIAPPVAAAPTLQPKQKPKFPLLRKTQKICPYCGKPATWIPQHQRWFCYNCQKYID
jgi:sporulation protein YlmC with PRC-barrel domain/ribosomal protein S27AE